MAKITAEGKTINIPDSAAVETILQKSTTEGSRQPKPIRRDQSQDSRKPPARASAGFQTGTGATLTQLIKRQRHSRLNNAVKETSPKSQNTIDTYPMPAQRGVFSFSPDWQLAGLIAAMISSVGLMVFAFHPELIDFLPVMFVSGMGLLVLTAYCAVTTDWLRTATTAPILVRIATGIVTIWGLIVIWASILFVGAIAAMAALAIALPFIILWAVLSGEK